ncbi:MAG TPA: nucleoid occlusion protein [Firmicutes bacterium]|nr:nucleoid occlusion protein [Bacillota bacterium]
MKDELARLIGLRRKGETGAKETVREIPLDLIGPNPYQPREAFDEESLRELADSIREHGLIQPVIVRQLGEKYEVIAGERRLRACRLAGLQTVPAIVRDMSPGESAEVSLVENLQRKDLNVLEEATGYQKLLGEFGLTQQELAKRVGKSQSTIANKLRLLKLPKPVLDALASEIISERHARALLRLPSEQEQVMVLRRIHAQGLTVGQTEALIDERLKEIRRKRVRRKVRGQEAGAVRAFKDIRVFLNSVRDVVRQLKATGVSVGFEEKDEGDVLELRIRIAKSGRDESGESQGPKAAEG